jgi:hypothetical protein
MNINVSLSEWIDHTRVGVDSLADINLVTMGDDADLSPPFLGIMESGSAMVEQGDVTMFGVSTYEITCELHTVPADEDQEGTPPETERLMRTDLTDILLNRDAIEWINGRNFWQVFDIRAAAPTTEAQEGRRVSRWNITIIAAPL